MPTKKKLLIIIIALKAFIIFVIDRIYCCFFVFLYNQGFYIQSITIWIYFDDIYNTITEHMISMLSFF